MVTKVVHKIWGISIALVGGCFSPSSFLDLNSSQSKAGMVVAPPELYTDQTNFSMGRTSSGSSEGSLLIPTDKASTIHAIEEANPIWTETQTPTEAIIQAPRKQTPVQAPAQYDTHDGLLNILSYDLVQPHDHVIILDSIAVVQCLKISPGMKKIISFNDDFVKRITRMVKPYDEERIIFDCYDIAQSLNL